MEIIINHLTRMRAGLICIAGIEPKTGAHVRPVLTGQLAVGLLQRNGGPFDIGRVVELGQVRPCGTAPETEDHFFDAAAAKALRDSKPKDFWALLQGVAKTRFAAIFGPALQAVRNGAAVTPGTGTASLGCLVPAESPVISINAWGKVRLQVGDGELGIDLSVTDVRFHQHDQWDADVAAVQDVGKRIKAGVPVLLSVGLARAFTARNDSERRHWLQVNGVHLEDDPAWQYT